jgi:hypothetical protein
LAGEKAVEYPGKWLVEIYFDNHLISTSAFELEPDINIERLPAFVRENCRLKIQAVLPVQE